MEIKRVIAGGMAALAAGASLALGAGAVTLGDFVQVTGNTMTSPYIVIGGNAAAEDTLAAADVGVALAGQATTTVTVPGAQGTMSVANGALIEGEAYKLYIGTALNNAQRKPDLTKDDLPVVLGGGTVDHKTISDTDYSEYLTMSSQTVQWAKEGEWEEAFLNLKFDTSTAAYTYKVVFDSGLDTDYIESKEVTLLGKDFVFSGQSTDLSNTSVVLYAAGQTETISAGSSSTVTIEGNDYVITVVGINTDGDAATIDVNGEAFDVNTGDDNYVTKGDLNLYIKSIRAFKFPAESGSVQVFIGSEKLTLDASNNAISQGETEVDGAWVDFPTVVGEKIYEIQITYTADEDAFLRADESLDDGIFDAFKIAYGGIFPALDSASKDLIEVEKSSSTKVKLSFINKAGNSCSMNVYNTTDWSYGSKPIQVDNTDVNVSTSADNIEEGHYFLASQGYNSYILQYVSTDKSNNIIKLKDMCSGTTFDASTQTGFFYLGGQKYDFDVDINNELLEVNMSGEAADLPVILYSAHKGGIVMTPGNPGEFIITEAPFSDAGIQGATRISINVTTTLASGEVDVIDAINGTESMVSKDDTDYEYGVTKAGTYVVRNTDSDTLKVYTPEVPSPVFVAVGANPSFTSGEGVTGGTVEQAVQIKNSVSKMESEISTSTLDRDVVLLGGPCANGLVATALGMSASKPQCVADFTAEYPTEGVIKVVSNVFASGQKALVVAGVDRDATKGLLTTALKAEKAVK
jgi:hypothetical protein